MARQSRLAVACTMLWRGRQLEWPAANNHQPAEPTATCPLQLTLHICFALCPAARQSYYWFKKTRERCIAEQGDACPMGGYTRLLHRCAAAAAMLAPCLLLVGWR